MSDMEETAEQFARDLAIASGDLPDTPAGPAPGVPTWRLDYLPVVQALTQAGYGRVEAARLRAALDAPRKTEAKIRVCQMQRMSARAWGQHEAIAKELGEDPNLATSDARTAWEWLVSQGDAAPLKTEAEIRADERDRLLCLALGSEEDDYYARDGYVAEWLRSQTQGEE